MGRRVRVGAHHRQSSVAALSLVVLGLCCVTSGLKPINAPVHDWSVGMRKLRGDRRSPGRHQDASGAGRGMIVAFPAAGCIRWSQCGRIVNGAAAEDSPLRRATEGDTDAMMAHCRKLQDIANANDGTRAVGTPGYQTSVDYVVNTLRSSGFDVRFHSLSHIPGSRKGW